MGKEPLDWQLEQHFWRQGIAPVVGMDEAGRGAWAGVVSVAVVLLPKGCYQFQDSKVLSAKKRAALALEIEAVALAYAVAHASPREIEKHNILKATHLAANRALKDVNQQLKGELAGIVSDYMHFKNKNLPVLSQARADATSPQVAAASILAKVARDQKMLELAQRYPAYGFEKHKGYGTKQHRAALAEYGLCPQHRRTFRPMKDMFSLDVELGIKNEP